MVTAAMKLKDTAWKECYDQPRQHTKKQRHFFANKGPSSQDYRFSSGHVWRWELDHKQSWALKNCCFWTVVLEKTLESPLDCKEIQPVNPKRNQPWILIGRTDAEAEIPILCDWCEELIHWKRLWSWERLKAGGEGDDREWDGWMASPTQWTWVWANSGSWWWARKPGVLQSTGSQREGHDWATELNWTEGEKKTTTKTCVSSVHRKTAPCISLPMCRHEMLAVAVLCVWWAKLCLTLCNPMDRSQPSSSVHRVLQVWMLEWAATPSSRGSSDPEVEAVSCVSCTGKRVLYHWASWEVPNGQWLPLSNKIPSYFLSMFAFLKYFP